MKRTTAFNDGIQNANTDNIAQVICDKNTSGKILNLNPDKRSDNCLPSYISRILPGPINLSSPAKINFSIFNSHNISENCNGNNLLSDANKIPCAKKTQECLASSTEKDIPPKPKLSNKTVPGVKRSRKASSGDVQANRILQYLVKHTSNSDV